MKNYYSLLLFTLTIFFVGCKSSTQLASQGNTHTVTTKKNEKLLQKYQQTITSEELKEHLYIIASDEMQGRDTGSEGQKKAAKYIVEKFKAMDLVGPVKAQDPYQQEIPFIQKKTNNVTISKENVDAKLFEDFYVWGNFQYGKDSVELIYIEDGLPETLSTLDIEGKAVLFHSELPNSYTGDKKWKDPISRVKNASEKGATFSILIRPSDKRFKKEVKLYRPYLEKPPLLYEAQAKKGSKTGMLITSPRLVSELFDGKSPTKAGQSTTLLFEAAVEEKNMTSSNILAYLEGSDKKDELIIVTAHYDHVGVTDGEIYNGADDDGSGTVTLLEIADAFTTATKEGFKPRRSILFMTVTGEEKGLLGSQYYTDYDPIFPLKNTVTNINIDMVGRSDSKYTDSIDYVYVIGSDMLSTELHKVQEDANARFGNGLTLDYTYNKKESPERYYYRSDHYNFAKNNIPVLFYFSGTHEDYHQPTDTPDKIAYELMEKRAKSIFATVWQLANRENKVVVDKAEKTDKSK